MTSREDKTVARPPRRTRAVRAALGAFAVVVAAVAVSVPPAAGAEGDGAISGRVTGTGGAGLAGCTVSADSRSWSHHGSATTDSTGAYTVGGLAFGEYRVEFSCTGYATGYYAGTDTAGSQPSYVVVEVGNTTEGVSVRMVVAGGISGRVTGSDGASLSNCGVVARAASGWALGGSATTDSAGAYAIGSLAPGPYKVRFSSCGDAAGEYYEDSGDESSALVVNVATGTNVGGIDARLNTGGRISGRVRGAGGAGLGGCSVSAVSTIDGWSSEWGTTDASGDYEIRGLRGGGYRVSFSGCAGHAGEYYDDATDYSGARTVSVVDGVDTSGVDADLAVAGRIRGTVAADDASPLAGCNVSAQGTTGGSGSGSATTDTSGTYEIQGLRAGGYRVYFSECAGHAGEYFDDATFEGADTVTVTAGATTSGIDARLAGAGAISGTVAAADGTPLAGCRVTVASYFGLYFGALSASTDAAGAYRVTGVLPGRYLVAFSTCAGHVGEYFDDVDMGAGWPYPDADWVVVTAGQDTSGVDARLDLGGAIGGTVTGADGAPLAGCGVWASSLASLPGGSATTDEAGHYEVAGLPPGGHRVGFSDCAGHAGEYYDDTGHSAAETVVVAAGATTSGVDARLSAGAISGTVADTGGAPLAGCSVWASSVAGGSSYGSATTDFAGGYRVGPLARGPHRVSFSCGGYAGEYYDDAAGYSDARPVEVAETGTTSGIDARLARSGVVSGRVTGPGGTPATSHSSCQVGAVGGESSAYDYVDDSGDYAITGLRPGAYKLSARCWSAAFAGGLWFDGKLSAHTADAVTVIEGGTVTGADFHFSAAGTIAGRVTDRAGDPMADCEVVAVDAGASGDGSTAESGSVFTDEDGSYTLAVQPGSHKVRFPACRGLAGEWHAGAADFAAAEALAVAPGGTVSGVDGSLEPLGSADMARGGMLRVTTSPPMDARLGLHDGGGEGEGEGDEWSATWVADHWGVNWLKLATGQYGLCPGDMPGYLTPDCMDADVRAGETTTLTAEYRAAGYLRVTTSPALPSTITVDGEPRNDWGVWMQIAPGPHRVCFGRVKDYRRPSCENVSVTAGATADVNGVFTSSTGAAGPSGSSGMLRVTTSPALGAQFLLDGVDVDHWGLNWMKVEPGFHSVCLRDMPGFRTPDCEYAMVVGGETAEVTAEYRESGYIRVVTAPASPSPIIVDGLPRDDGGAWFQIDPGAHKVCFGGVQGLQAPPCTTATVSVGSTTTVTGTFVPA